MCGKPERQPRSGTPALRTRVPPGCVAAPLGRTAMSLETRGSNVGDTRGGRDRMHARTRLAPRRCSRSRVAFSRRTSRKGARNKPQRISCQLPRQAPGSTTPGTSPRTSRPGIFSTRLNAVAHCPETEHGLPVPRGPLGGGRESAPITVHRIASAAGVPGLENLASLDQVPEVGAWVIALPMKIGGGSGGPLRAVALVPMDGDRR